MMTVVSIQNALISRGYDVGPAGADGDAGPATIAALMAFQSAAGLVADGIAGPLTEAALEQDADAETRAEPEMPPWLALAIQEKGIVEDIGKGSNPKVIAYFKDAGFGGVKDDAVPWCAAFVGAMLQRAGVQPSRSLAARSYETWGVGLKNPVLGCIGTKRRAGNKASWQGHVGFVVGANDDTIYMLGGNQSDAVSLSKFVRAEFTGFRWPSTLPIPRKSTLPTSMTARLKVSEA